MIDGLNGQLLQPQIGVLLVTCGGVTFRCQISHTTAAALQGQHEGQIFTHLSVREDGMELYGFATLSERQCFLSLISVSGVGPKVALAVLSAMTPEAFARAVALGDHKAISQAKGVGPKMAMRMVLELKDKLAKEVGDQAAVAGLPSFGAAVAPTDATAEALQALQVLGYSAKEAEDALGKVMRGENPPQDAGEQIRLSLRYLARG